MGIEINDKSIKAIAEDVASSINAHIGYGSKHKTHYVTNGADLPIIRANMEKHETRKAAAIVEKILREHFGLVNEE